MTNPWIIAERFTSSSLPCKCVCDDGEQRDSVKIVSKLERPNIYCFSRICLHFHHQVLVIELQFFKYVKYMHSINQMRLFWLLNLKLNKMYFKSIMKKYFIISNQNKRIWLTECIYLTCLKNCSCITNAWWRKCNRKHKKKNQMFGCVYIWDKDQIDTFFTEVLLYL